MCRPTIELRNALALDVEDIGAESPVANSTVATSAAGLSEIVDAELVQRRSWLFAAGDWGAWFFSFLFGIASIVLLLAVAASTPVLQFASFGYLLDVSGRVGRTGRMRDGMIGIGKASRIGGFILGAWLCLIPVRIASDYWYSAWLIDPTSNQTLSLRWVQIILLVLTVLHIVAAWLCGGRLRYFFWPFIAPLQFVSWLARRALLSPVIGKLLDVTFGRLAPNLLTDLRDTKPISDWFLPAIVLRRIREPNWLEQTADGLWVFVAGLRLPYYLWLGIKGFFGSLLWLALPTLLLVMATNQNEAVAIFSGLIGVVVATAIFSVLLFQQTHFAATTRFGSFFELGESFRVFRRAPLFHLLAGLLTLLFALPLFLLKIEEIPAELMWSLTIVFVVFSWPTRIALGFAYGRAAKKSRMKPWWWSFPLAAAIVPLCFLFVVIMFFTRYTSWNGALSMLENHVFLLPAPFWLKL